MPIKLRQAVRKIDEQLAELRRFAELEQSQPAQTMIDELAADAAQARALAAPWLGEASEPSAEPSNVIDAGDRFRRPDDAAASEPAATVQRRAAGAPEDPAQVQSHAAEGVAGRGTALPHIDAIQRSFGAHDLTGVSAHVGGAAADASAAIGAEAYATGNHVAFAEAPSLFVAAHEAAHVVQQRAGVSLLGGVGVAGDTYEQHADAVAEKVVSGASAAELLGPVSSEAASTGVQRRKHKHEGDPLVLDLLAAIDGAARSALARLDEDADLSTASELAAKIVARIDHLLSVTAVPGKDPDLTRYADDAALAFGHTQELADRFDSPTQVIGAPDLTAAHQWNDPAANAALVTALDHVSSELAPRAKWTWTATSSTRKAGKGMTRKVGAAIVTETLDVIETRIAAVRDTTEMVPIRATFGAVVEELGHAAREAELASTDAKTRKALSKDVKRFQKVLHAFRDRIASSKSTWAALPIASMRDAEARLLQTVGLEVDTTVWNDGVANAFAAEKRLSELRQRRNTGEDVDAKDQFEAQKDAVAAGDTAIGAAKGASGTEITDVKNELQAQIASIKKARTVGYQNALNHLALHGKESYESLGHSLASRADWVVSGVLPSGPIKGVGKAVTAGLKYITEIPASNWNASVKMAPGMLAGFPDGAPVGASSAQLLMVAQRQLDALNDALFEAMQRDLYEHIAHVVAHSPPDQTVDAQRYAAELQVALQYALFPDVFAQGLNNGELPADSKIAVHTENQLLNRYVLTHASVGEDGFQATRSFRGRAEVDEAVDLLGGDDQVEVGRYELVANQIHTAAHDMGCAVDLDADQLQAAIDDGKDLLIPVTYFNPHVVWGGSSPTRWSSFFQFDKIAQCEPSIDNEAYLGPKSLEIDAIEIRAKDLKEVKVGKRDIYNLERLRFVARGLNQTDSDHKRVFEDEDDDPQSCFICVDMPEHFKIRYWIGP